MAPDRAAIERSTRPRRRRRRRAAHARAVRRSGRPRCTRGAAPGPSAVGSRPNGIGVHFSDRPLLLRSLAHRSWCAENGVASRTSGSSSSATPCSGWSSPITCSSTSRLCPRVSSPKYAPVWSMRASSPSSRWRSIWVRTCCSARVRMQPAGGPSSRSWPMLFEAVIAAVYLDHGFADRARPGAAMPFGADRRSGGRPRRSRLQDPFPGGNRGPFARTAPIRRSRRGAGSRRSNSSRRSS